MTRARARLVLALLASPVLTPGVGTAQATVDAQLDLFSAYVWRGLTLTNRPVAEPALSVTFPAGAASVTAGGWVNIDLGRYDDTVDQISQSGGISGFNLSEFDPYAEVSVPAGKVTLTGGVIGYIYPNDTGAATGEANTWEVYGKVGLDLPLAPELTVYYDIDKVNGAYLEGGLSHWVALGPRATLDLAAVAGFSTGQAESADEINNLVENGFTHLELSAGVPLTAGAFALTPVLHLIVAADEAVEVTSPTRRRDVKLWGGLSLAWSHGPAE